MEIIIQHTKKFEKDISKISEKEKNIFTRLINLFIDSLKNNQSSHYPPMKKANIILKNNLDTSIYIMQVKQLRLLFSLDDDPLFDQKIITMYRLIPPSKYSKAFANLAESHYQNYLDNYTIDEGE